MPSTPDENELFLHEDAAKKLNAIYANRIYAQPLAEGLVRVNFGEFSDWEPKYHSAIVITPESALEMARVLESVATGVIEQQRRMEALDKVASDAAERLSPRYAETPTAPDPGTQDVPGQP